MTSPGAALPRIGLSTASVFPEPTEAGFELAAALGYDGVEVMVWTDPASQDLNGLRRLRDRYRVPILAVHAPCLLATQRVWTVDPWTKLTRARAAAEALDAQTVVVHPPFRWQREYARGFTRGIARMAEQTEVRFAVENMYPLRLGGRSVSAYLPSWDVAASDEPHQAYTLDLSHTAVSRTDALAMLQVMAGRLAHVHVADGTGAARDEHLVPGRGTQPCAEVLAALPAQGFTGHVVVEVSTRHAADRAEREADLAAALAFCRRHLAVESWRP